MKKEPGYIDCSSIFTIEKRLVVKVAGRLTKEVLLGVKGELKKDRVTGACG